ncbi:hypothetical protein BJK06_16890 [Curtobacterium sp. BH-2-1-1]|uniref:lysylphosphatidylglycerol synthase transmembrane domain-containing protein n=1 Tax=Curtobacterium sp. BH-2-1-1 TaxID=1905847 RepID=UPI00089DDBAD|nr:lysylphosphatidylglycerol synthase transmembrane domain-containing protein [Curtobacterium sp. BH-2-1-1]AOX67170.1 hypothetical protein BJK06_16890 [Curtobacterium sp. BH-2-1-1]
MRWVLLAVTPFLLATAVLVALPHLRDAGIVLRTLDPVALPAAAVAVLAEAVSLTAASRASRLLLGPDAPAFRHVLGVDIVAQGVRSLLPGGAATSAGARISLLERFGVSASAAASSATTGVVVSNLVLSALFLFGLAVAARAAPPPLVSGAIGLVLALVVTSGAVGWLLLRHPAAARRTAVRWSSPLRRFAHRPSGAVVAEYVDALASGLRRLRSPRAFGALFAWTVLNWAADLGAFGLMVAAAGAHPRPEVVILTYGLVNILATVPVTPGAVGIVEGAAVASLHLAGVPTAVALVGVLGWRLVEYWLPLVAALVATPVVLVASRRRPDPAGLGRTFATRRRRPRPRPWPHGHPRTPPRRTADRP